RSGFISGVATREIGLAVLSLGGGRSNPHDKIDHSVGITGLLPIGTEINKGEPMAIIHARRQDDAEKAAAALLDAYHIAEAKPHRRKAVMRRVADL
ncbi:MAG: thymidine phosphorylase, partial [Rhizobiaceae bacterium]